jgi:hypothetical protein
MPYPKSASVLAITVLLFLVGCTSQGPEERAAQEDSPPLATVAIQDATPSPWRVDLTPIQAPDKPKLHIPATMLRGAYRNNFTKAMEGIDIIYHQLALALAAESGINPILAFVEPDRFISEFKKTREFLTFQNYVMCAKRTIQDDRQAATEAALLETGLRQALARSHRQDKADGYFDGWTPADGSPTEYMEPMSEFDLTLLTDLGFDRNQVIACLEEQRVLQPLASYDCSFPVELRGAALQMHQNHLISETSYQAQKGDEESQFALAMAYYSGLGVPQDHERAFGMFQSLAERGNPHAQFIVASMYAEGAGTGQSCEQAKYWYEKAAANSFPLAYHNLGIYYFDESCCPRDLIKAYQWCYLSAMEGTEESVAGLDRLAVMMSAAEIDEAMALARQWQAQHGN